jgi:hypothetical protein
MRLREPAAEPSQHPVPEHAPDVSLRVLVLVGVSILLAVFAWRVPASVNPMLIAVATFAVLDRMTDQARRR